MHPSGYTHHLGELHRLAYTLFDQLRSRFRVEGSPPIRFDRIESLVDTAIEEEHLVATLLLCAQLLHKVTRIPERARPRHIMILCDIIDEALTTLLEECHRDQVTAEMRRTQARICTLGMNLVVVADPGAPGFSDWSEWPNLPS